MTPKQEAFVREYASAVRSGFAFYVYVLADGDGVFYVGKGKGRRMLEHRATDTNGAKAARISAAGESLQRFAIAHFRDEPAAYAFERELIAAQRDELTNMAGGVVTGQEAAMGRAKVLLMWMKPYREWIETTDPERVASAARSFNGSPQEAYRQYKQAVERLANGAA